MTHEPFDLSTLRMIMLPDGSFTPRLPYMDKPQGTWTAEETEHHARLQELMLDRGGAVLQEGVNHE